MNTLTWFLYLIGIVPSLSSALGAVCIFGFVICLLTFIIKWIVRSDANHDNKYFLKHEDKIEIPTPVEKTFFGISKIALTVAFVAGTLYVLIPPERTMILMASSEVGERVLTSDKVVGIVNPSVELLKKYIEKETLKIKREISSVTNPPSAPAPKSEHSL